MPAGDMTESQGLSGKDRVIRVFISSTFRDMMRERDLLVKEVFPELRRKCARRFVTFTEVDLRWGNGHEQKMTPTRQGARPAVHQGLDFILEAAYHRQTFLCRSAINQTQRLP
jgi:hypothetical protein